MISDQPFAGSFICCSLVCYPTLQSLLHISWLLENTDHRLGTLYIVLAHHLYLFRETLRPPLISECHPYSLSPLGCHIDMKFEPRYMYELAILINESVYCFNSFIISTCSQKLSLRPIGNEPQCIAPQYR